MKKYTFIILFVCTVTNIFSQADSIAMQNLRLQGIEKRKALENNSLVKNVEFINIGPTIMSGRVTDIDVKPSDPTKFYVAYASGGVWYTENNGQSFKPVFDNEAVITVGDIAVDWNNNVIYVGTGEVNSSRSSYAGVGIYRSDNGGATWEYCGLPESHHIGRIVINYREPNIVYAAVLGHLYTPNAERGIYKSIDGGKTWKQSLFVDENTGAVDIVIDPNVPDFLYATTWQRDRKAWNFSEAGSGSGIYKSVDAGETWTLLSKPGAGFPTGENVGRIGIAVSYQHNNIVYAVVDNQNPKEQDPALREAQASSLNMDSLKVITKEKFALIDDAALQQFLADKKFPEDFSASFIKTKVASGEFAPTVLTDFLNDGGYVFDLPIKGCEIYRSDDGGTTWFRTHDKYLDGAFFTYGYYFSTIKVSPKNDNKIIVSAFNALMSEDGGKTFKNIDGSNVHPDHHASWMNPANDKHIIIGNDGGVNISYDNGTNWFLANNPSVGQFYSIEVDDAKPYNVYGGLQDNGVWSGPSNYTPNNYWQQGGKYPYQPIYGGDGMQVQVDRRDNETIYTGYQYGYYARVNKSSGSEELSIRPKHDFGELPLRYNWQTPICLSRHNQDILYYGSNKFHRSMNNGEMMVTLSDDLTNGKKAGDVPYATITTISESPKRFGLLYCGTDDGNIWVSKNDGYDWDQINVAIKKEIAPAKGKTPATTINLSPEGLWVSRIIAGKFNEGTVYASLNGYRNDDFNPYLFVSDNYGTTWKQIGADLPMEPINVVREDPKNKNIIYVGTDNGLYVSMNGGNSFMDFSTGIPRVAVHDLAIQERDNELVVATHGRSIYKTSLDQIQKMDSIMNEEVFIYKPENINYDENQGKLFTTFDAANESTYDFAYYVKSPGTANITIASANGTILKEFTDNSEAGINFIKYDLSFEERNKPAFEQYLDELPVTTTRKVANIKAADNGKFYLVPGKYIIKLSTSTGSDQLNFELVQN